MNERERRAKETIQTALATFVSEPLKQASLKFLTFLDIEARSG